MCKESLKNSWHSTPLYFSGHRKKINWIVMVTIAISSYIISLSALLQEIFTLQEVFQFIFLNCWSKSKHIWAFYKSLSKLIFLKRRKGILLWTYILRKNPRRQNNTAKAKENRTKQNKKPGKKFLKKSQAQVQKHDGKANLSHWRNEKSNS